MDQRGLSQPPPSSSTTENPVVAVGRKVKSVLSTHQRPSVRILREPVSIGEPRLVPVSKGIAAKLAPRLSPYGRAQRPDSRVESAEQYAAHAEASRATSKESTFANHFADARNRTVAAIRSLVSHEEDFTNDESFEDEYDPDTVDLLDVVGTYDQTQSSRERTDSLQTQKYLHFLP